MKQLILLIAIIGLGSISNAQTDSLHLTNALVVSHMDNQEDRYSLEVAISEMLSANQVKKRRFTQCVETRWRSAGIDDRFAHTNPGWKRNQYHDAGFDQGIR